MTDQTFADDELTALLERAIGPGPDGPALDVLLREGGRAARRRRTGLAAVVAVVVVVAGTGAVAAMARGQSRADVGPVVAPATTQPGPPLATDTVSLDDFLESGDLAVLRAGGLLRLRPGVEVARWVDNPMDSTPPDHSIGLVLRYHGEETWHLLEYDDLGDSAAGTSGSSVRAGEVAGTFDAWLADTVRQHQRPVPELDDPLGNVPGEPLVELQPDGSLDLAPGVEVLDRIDNPVHHTPPDRSVAVAFTYDGRERWAVLQILVDAGGRVLGGGVTPVYADRAREPTLAEFAAHNDNKVYQQ